MFNTLVDERNRHAQSMFSPPTNKQTTALKNMDAALHTQQKRLTALQVELDRSFSQLENSPPHSPAAASMLTVLGKPGRAPTAYVRISVEEAFAECFALFYVDPRALQRAHPAVYAWFKSGGHLAAQEVEKP